MKILFFSDIHANHEALKHLEPYIEQADMSICLGDLVGYSCSVNEVVDFLRSREIVCIQGNHERYLLEGLESQKKEINDSVRFGIEFAQKTITLDNLKWISSLPISFGFFADGLSFLCCHGSPFDPVNGYIYENNTDFGIFDKFRYDVIVLGHTHRAMSIKRLDKVILNPGSVGQSRDYEGVVCAVIIDTETLEQETLRILYDFRKNLSISLSNGAGDWIFKHYRTVL